MTPNQFRPHLGVLKGKQEVSVTISPPIAEHEQALVLSPGSVVVVTEEMATEVRVRNNGSKTVAYMIVVVPSAMVRATNYPWPEVVRGLQERVTHEGGWRVLLQGLLNVTAK
jgi:hypothetical protein